MSSGRLDAALGGRSKGSHCVDASRGEGENICFEVLELALPQMKLGTFKVGIKLMLMVMLILALPCVIRYQTGITSCRNLFFMMLI